jgi:mono/diheme cytochrome c family protein
MNRKIWYLLLLMGLAVQGYAAAPPSKEEGALIFKARCAACHNINKRVVGPALAGVGDRRSLEWITKFVQSSQSLISSGDKDAQALFAEFNNTPMPDHRDITADQVASLVEYIKSETKAATPDGVATVEYKPGVRPPAYRPLMLSDYGYITGFIAVVALLVLVMLMMVRVKDVEREMQNDK